MSTKFTIRHGEGFHLYADWLDEVIDADVVHLRLDDVVFEACSPGQVTITLSRARAEELGLLRDRAPRR